MTKAKRHVCEFCHGVLTGSQRIPLELCVTHHLEACPANFRLKKPAPPVVVQEPPRRRVIPRTKLSSAG